MRPVKLVEDGMLSGNLAKVGSESPEDARVVLIIPQGLAESCRGSAVRTAWLERLPALLRELAAKWRLALDEPFDGPDASCAWVAPVSRADGTRAVLKVGMPHMEGSHEIQGLDFWNGNPTVRLLASERELNAMLLERCEPGTSLRARPEPEQDRVIAGLLRRLWRAPALPHPFRPLALMTELWTAETMERESEWPDAALVRAGLRLFEELSRPSSEDVLLATDLHAGNVLRARREPWLVIDPKPFVGDRAYDATQHLINCRDRLLTAPEATIQSFSDQLEIDAERVQSWLFARAAAEARGDWSLTLAMTLAKVLG